MFESWLAALPLPAREAPMDAEVEVAAAAGYISDEAFYAQDDVVWGIYQTHPHLGAEAMAELLLPHVGSVTVATVQSWLRNARTTELGLDRLRLYRQCVEDYVGLVPESTESSIAAFLETDFNIKVPHATTGRLLQEIEQPAGMKSLSYEQLPLHQVYLEQLVQQEPILSPMRILQGLQQDVGVTSTVKTISRWMCVCGDDADDIWNYGKHDVMVLPWLEDLPEPMRHALPEPMLGALAEQCGLVAKDLFEAVGYWLHSHYGSAVWEVTVDSAGKPMVCEASPSKGPHSEAPGVAVSVLDGPVSLRRFGHLCQAEGCIFSTGQPGQPARAEHSRFCMWCDAEAMKAELQSTSGRAKIAKALTLFSKHPTTHSAALALLPDDFQTGDRRYCQARGCPFNMHRPGNPGRCVGASTHCIWHDASARDSALRSEEGRKSIRRSVALLKQSGAEHDDGAYLWEHALRLLPADFALSARMCANSCCRFSLLRIGQPARSQQTSDLCAWCDTGVLASRESTEAGRRLIAYALSKWVARTDVLLAAWGKLSPEFRAAATRPASRTWENRAMAKHDWVHRCQSRTRPYITQPAMCSVCRSKPSTISLRRDIKEFESVAAASAAAAGEARVPIETDAHWLRLLFAGCGETLSFDTTSFCRECLDLQRVRPLRARCALCLESLRPGLWNDRHQENSGGCSGHEAPPRAGVYLESKTGLHVVALLHRSAEISAMWSNDKYVEQPELTFKQLLAQEQEWRQCRWRRQEAERTRELEAMMCEDYVVFEKVFMVVQLDPLGRNSMWPQQRAFDDLAAALEWLRAPSMQDDAIRRYMQALASWGTSVSGEPEDGCAQPPLLESTWTQLPITAELRTELLARQTESPRHMMLYRSPYWNPCLWSYLDAQERAIHITPSPTYRLRGELVINWEAQPFPWVEMPRMLQNVINFLRSRGSYI